MNAKIEDSDSCCHTGVSDPAHEGLECRIGRGVRVRVTQHLLGTLRDLGPARALWAALIRTPARFVVTREACATQTQPQFVRLASSRNHARLYNDCTTCVAWKRSVPQLAPVSTIRLQMLGGCDFDHACTQQVQTRPLTTKIVLICGNTI